jgi:hypothetical protein
MVPDEIYGELIKYSVKFYEKFQFIVFALTTFVLCAVAIGYFKARLLQIRICILNMLILFAYQIWILVTFFQMKSVYTFTVATLFPFVCIVLLLLSIRYIWRDESEVLAYGYVQKGKRNRKKRNR